VLSVNFFVLGELIEIGRYRSNLPA
jgi:hypothetical protein